MSEDNKNNNHSGKDFSEILEYKIAEALVYFYENDIEFNTETFFGNIKAMIKLFYQIINPKKGIEKNEDNSKTKTFIEEMRGSGSKDNFRVINVNKLGYFLDGWADLVEGMGEKQSKVFSDTFTLLVNRNMRGVKVFRVEGHDGSSFRPRNHVFLQFNPGVTLSLYIADRENDLYLSWRTWIKLVLNLFLIIIIILIASALGFASFGTHSIGGGIFSSGTEVFWPLGFSLSTIVFLILEVVLIIFLGKVAKGDPFALFFIEPTVFDADDVSALELIVHKTLLRVLDQEGIDISKLRLKEKFTGGRKGEDI